MKIYIFIIWEDISSKKINLHIFSSYLFGQCSQRDLDPNASSKFARPKFARPKFAGSNWVPRSFENFGQFRILRIFGTPGIFGFGWPKLEIFRSRLTKRIESKTRLPLIKMHQLFCQNSVLTNLSTQKNSWLRPCNILHSNKYFLFIRPLTHIETHISAKVKINSK